MFVDLDRPVTRLELPEVYERLVQYVDQTTARVAPQYLGELTKASHRDAAGLVAYLDPDAAAYRKLIQDLLTLQNRYDYVTTSHSMRLRSAAKQLGVTKLLLCQAVETLTTLEFLLDAARIARDRKYRGRAFHLYWRDVREPVAPAPE